MFFERLEGFVMNELQSFLLGEPAFGLERERVIELREPVTGRME
jgi:hypothetical protein